MTRDTTRKMLDDMLGEDADELHSRQDGRERPPTNATAHARALNEPLGELAMARLTSLAMDAFDEDDEEAAEEEAEPAPAPEVAAAAPNVVPLRPARSWGWAAASTLALAAAALFVLGLPGEMPPGSNEPVSISLTRGDEPGAEAAMLELNVPAASSGPGCEGGVVVYALGGDQPRELVLNCSAKGGSLELTGTVGEEVRLDHGRQRLVVLVGPGVRLPAWPQIEGVLPGGGVVGEWEVHAVTVDVGAP